jgi:AraC-like DNA-binding protein
MVSGLDRGINDAAKRQPLWWTRSRQHPRPLIGELQSLGRGSLALLDLDRASRPIGGSFLEICCVARGTDEWRFSGRNLRVGPGDLSIVGPSHRVSRPGNRAPPGEVRWLTLDLESSRGDGGPPLDVLDHDGPRAFRAPPPLPALFDRLLSEHRLADPHAGWAARGALHCLLAEMLRSREAAPGGPVPVTFSEPIAAAIAVIDEHLAEPLTVAALAAGVRLSPGRFHQRFLLETGYAPADFRARRRLERAKELLADSGLSITDIALTLGFSTSQYFATFFRRFTGVSPRDHRRQARI